MRSLTNHQPSKGKHHEQLTRTICTILALCYRYLGSVDDTVINFKGKSIMFTVTHYGLSKDFESIYKAMRYLKSVRMIHAVLWSTERPLTDTSRFIKPSKWVW